MFVNYYMPVMPSNQGAFIFTMSAFNMVYENVCEMSSYTYKQLRGECDKLLLPLHVTKYCVIIDILTRTVIYTGNVYMFYACTSIIVVD